MARKPGPASKRPKRKSSKKQDAPDPPALKPGERFVEAFPLVDGAPVPTWARVKKSRPRPDPGLMGILPQGALPLQPNRPTGPADLKSIRHPAGTRIQFLLVSEGFPDTDPGRFFDRARKVSDALLGAEPFKSLQANIAIHALFLPLAGSAVVDIKCDRSAANKAKLKPTLFATQCCVDGTTPHLWCGDEDVVRKVVGAALSNNGRAITDYQFLAVLIDSASYGGAGSIPNSTAKPRLAWATTDHPQSPLILLHELGHAFGLQDEYEVAQAEPVKPWHNISRFARPDATPWQSLVTAPNHTAVTCPAGTKWTGTVSTIGTFEGAGYKVRDRYRPTVQCRMRELAADFCEVCADHIKSVIDPGHARRVGEEN